MRARSTHLPQDRIVASRVAMGIVVCGNFASFEIVAEPGNGLCWATGGMEVGYGREEHCSVVVVLFSSEATLGSFVTPWTMLVRYRWT